MCRRPAVSTSSNIAPRLGALAPRGSRQIERRLLLGSALIERLADVARDDFELFARAGGILHGDQHGR